MARTALRARPTGLDRTLLVLPMAAGLLGLALILLAVPVGSLAGYAGNDQFFYWLAGAAALGYGVSLAVGIAEGSWRAVRSVVIAVLVFNLVSLYACSLEMLAGRSTALVDIIAAASIVQIATAIWLLYEHRYAPAGRANIPGGRLALAVMWIAILAATLFGSLGRSCPSAPRTSSAIRGARSFSTARLAPPLLAARSWACSTSGPRVGVRCGFQS